MKIPVHGAVVTKIRRGVDSKGYWKHALIQGERFPFIDLCDSPFVDFVASLRSRGYVVPDDVTVEDCTTHDTVLFGVHRLSEILAAEARQASR